MPLARRVVIGFSAVLLLLSGALGWYITRRVDSTPVAVAAHELSRWSLITSDGTDPWVVAMQPPVSLNASLFREVSRRAGQALVAPAHPALPLVLRAEFDEGLQGVYGIDSVLRIAREAGIDRGAFTPVCLAHRTTSGPSGAAELYFVPFESAAFNQVRADLVPVEPEHAGIGVYEPATLSPILLVAATDNRFDRWWPLTFDRAVDCEADLGPVAAQN